MHFGLPMLVSEKPEMRAVWQLNKIMAGLGESPGL